MPGRLQSGNREASSEDFSKSVRLLAGALVVCTLAATAGCSHSGNAVSPTAEGSAGLNSSAASDWAAVEDGLNRDLDDKTRAALADASRGDAGAQGSVAPETIRAGSE